VDLPTSCQTTKKSPYVIPTDFLIGPPRSYDRTKTCVMHCNPLRLQVNKVFCAGSSVISQVQKSCFSDRFSWSVYLSRPGPGSLWSLNTTSKEIAIIQMALERIPPSFECSLWVASVLSKTVFVYLTASGGAAHLC
jgi:hypothetical protein